MAKRKRDIQLKFRVTPQEREMIETKMAQFGTTNMAAYLRKMAMYAAFTPRKHWWLMPVLMLRRMILAM